METMEEIQLTKQVFYHRPFRYRRLNISNGEQERGIRQNGVDSWKGLKAMKVCRALIQFILFNYNLFIHLYLFIFCLLYKYDINKYIYKYFIFSNYFIVYAKYDKLYVTCSIIPVIYTQIHKLFVIFNCPKCLTNKILCHELVLSVCYITYIITIFYHFKYKMCEINRLITIDKSTLRLVSKMSQQKQV